MLDIKPKEISVFDDEESILSVVLSIPNATSDISSDVNTKIDDKSIAQIIAVEDDIIKTNSSDKKSTYKFGIKIVGNKIGRTVAVFDFTDSRNSSLDLIVSNSLIVKRRWTVFDNILSYVLGLLVVINNFGFGCNFDYTVGKEPAKAPKPVFIGVVCQFLILPLVTFHAHFSKIINDILCKE